MNKARRVPKGGIALRGSSEDDRFTTLDAVIALNGVCIALDAAGGTDDPNSVHQLSTAAKILSSIVYDRIDL